MVSINLYGKQETINIKVDKNQGLWLAAILPLLSINNPKLATLKDLKTSYEVAGLEDFELFWDNKPINGLYKAGLLQL